MLTGGQTSLVLAHEGEEGGMGQAGVIHRVQGDHWKLAVPRATDEEMKEHEAFLALLDKKSGGECVWLQNGSDGEDVH